MNQRRRLAVLSEHMESRLVLSPVMMLPIHGTDADTDQGAAEVPSERSSPKEQLLGRSSQVRQTSPSTQDKTETPDSRHDVAGSATLSVDDRGPLSPIVDSRANADATEGVSSTSASGTSQESTAHSQQTVDGTTFTGAAETSASPQESVVTVESVPASLDRTVAVAREQGPAKEAVSIDSTKGDVVDVSATVLSSGTVSVEATEVLSRSGAESMSLPETFDSTDGAADRTTEGAPERVRGGSSTEVTADVIGDAIRIDTVRPVVTDEESQSQSSRALIVDTQPVRPADVDTGDGAVNVSDVARPVPIATAKNHSPTPDAQITDRVKTSAITEASSEPAGSDTDFDEADEVADSTIKSDANVHPVAAELLCAIDRDGTDTSSSMAHQRPGRISDGNGVASQWASGLVLTPEPSRNVGVDTAAIPNAISSLPWSSWLMSSESRAEICTDHERNATTETFFGDATRVGLMLATVRHAGRRSGNAFRVTESLDELRSEGSSCSRERRRRRAAMARSMPTSFHRTRQVIYPLEYVDGHNSLPNARPSTDDVFADAASMSLLYQDNFGSSDSSRPGVPWSILLLGGAGFAVNRAGRNRKSQTPRQLIPPPVPRSAGETLKFAN
ncbi:MAG: hypothetical protein P8J37_06980 [Fuerstiella sp.]|nr:hypothetical protein [Fuerstiella sp.]